MQSLIKVNEWHLCLHNFLFNFSGDLYAQISPVCAIIGGVMGQEIIKTVSQKERPHNNLFVFNPMTLCGQVLRISWDVN